MNTGSEEYIKLLDADPQTRKIEKAGKIAAYTGFVGMAIATALGIYLNLTPHPESNQCLSPLLVLAPAILSIIRAINRQAASDKIMKGKIASGQVSEKP